jgi:hypothetical protein
MLLFVKKTVTVAKYKKSVKRNRLQSNGQERCSGGKVRKSGKLVKCNTIFCLDYRL